MCGGDALVVVFFSFLYVFFKRISFVCPKRFLVYAFINFVSRSM
jgi:hypothetical protein